MHYRRIDTRALEACCRGGDVEVWRLPACRRDTPELRAEGVGTWRSLPQEVWGSGDASQACRIEVWSCAAGVGTWRCSPQEIGSSAGALQALPLCLKRFGALEACCTCSDVEEAQRFGPLEMRCSRRRSGGQRIVVVGISSFRSSRLFGQNACGLRHLY